MTRGTRFVLALISILAVGCAAPSAAPNGPAQSAPTATVAPASAKTLTVIASQALRTWAPNTDEPTDFVHAGLTTRNADTLEPVPWAAVALPSTDAGTWIVNADGTMTTTYTLRPNIKWHDGTLFTSGDVEYGWELNLDNNVPFNSRTVANQISSIDTPDDLTVVVHWTQPYLWANQLQRGQLLPLPRHILEPVRASGQPLDQYDYWSTQFVGIGPYRVERMEPGQEADLIANPDYFLGRPKIDRIIYRMVPDSATALSSVLSNAADVSLRLALTVDDGITAKDRWENQGDGTVFIVPVAQWFYNLSGLNPIFDDRRVRQALQLALDREEINQAVFAGHEQVFDVPFSPRRPEYTQLDAAVTHYPYDPARAAELLADAGWTKGADGALHDAQGNPLSFEARTTIGQNALEQLEQASISYWQALGVENPVNNVSAQAATDDQYRNHWPGANWQGGPVTPEGIYPTYYSAFIPTDENRWNGSNTSRWNDPQNDALLDQMNRAIDQSTWDALLVQWGQLFSQELPNSPIVFGSDVTTVAKGVTGVGPRYETGDTNSRMWNSYLWDKQ